MCLLSPSSISPSLLCCKMKAYKLFSLTHCQMVSSGFPPMVYTVEFWRQKGRKEACSCLVQASETASLRRGSWLPLKCTLCGIKALIPNCPLLPSVLLTLLPADTPRLHTSAQGRGNLLGSWSLSFQYCLTDCSALPIAPDFFQDLCNQFLLLNHLS